MNDDIHLQFTLFDLQVREWLAAYRSRGGRIFCRKGCSACCSLAVNCTLSEAQAIARTLSDAQAAAVRGHVARLVAHLTAAPDLKAWLRLHRTAIGRCPFLDADGACVIYAVRPFSCRALLATKESHWCGVDFAGLTAAEKEAFVASLDTTVVAFPMHYVATTQELARELEIRASRRMAERCGFSLYGNLPVLVQLERDHRLSELVAQGETATVRLLERTAVDHPFLVVLERTGPNSI